MTRVMIRKDSDGVGISMQGHAGLAPLGQDPLCGALSVLAYTMAQYFGRLEAQGKLLCSPRIELAPGQAHLEAKAKPPYLRELHYGMEILEGGLCLLAQSFPYAVELSLEDTSI